MCMTGIQTEMCVYTLLLLKYVRFIDMDNILKYTCMRLDI